MLESSQSSKSQNQEDVFSFFKQCAQWYMSSSLCVLWKGVMFTENVFLSTQ